MFSTADLHLLYIYIFLPFFIGYYQQFNYLCQKFIALLQRELSEHATKNVYKTR